MNINDLIKMRKKIGTSLLVVNYMFWKFLRINKTAKWPINFTSRVSFGQNIFVLDDCGDLTLFKCLNLSYGVYLQGRNGIYLSSSVHLAPGVKLISANHDHYNRKEHELTSPIVLGKNVWLGANTVVLPGVKIGDNSIIGAGSVVSKDVPSNVVYAGVPASFIKALNCAEQLKNS